MAAPADMEPINIADETTSESDLFSRLKRYDQRVVATYTRLSSSVWSITRCEVLRDAFRCEASNSFAKRLQDSIACGAIFVLVGW